MADMFVRDNIARTSGLAASKNGELAVLHIGDGHCAAVGMFGSVSERDMILRILAEADGRVI
jgi:hypothetical protein